MYPRQDPVGSQRGFKGVAAININPLPFRTFLARYLKYIKITNCICFATFTIFVISHTDANPQYCYYNHNTRYSLLANKNCFTKQKIYNTKKILLCYFLKGKGAYFASKEAKSYFKYISELAFRHQFYYFTKAYTR